MNRSAHLAAACAALLAAAPVAAEMVDATNPGYLASIIRELGYRARVDVDGIGDPMILSAAGGVDFAIYFYGCTDGKQCSTLLFKAGFDLPEGTTTDSMDEWNESTLYGRAFLDDEDDPWIELSVNMQGGVSRENFEDTFDWWDTILNDFRNHIAF